MAWNNRGGAPQLIALNGGFQSRAPQGGQFDDFMVGKRVTQFLPADHRFEREDEDGSRIELSRDNCEVVVVAEPPEKKGVMKLMKLQRVVCGYFLCGEDMDESKTRMMQAESLLDLRCSDEAWAARMRALERVNHDYRCHVDSVEDLLYRKKLETVNQQKLRLEKKLNRLNEAVEVKLDPVVQQKQDRDALLRELIGLKIRHEQNVEGQIVHCFADDTTAAVSAEASGPKVYCVCSFPNRPDLMVTAGLSVIKQQLLDANDKTTTEAKITAVENIRRSERPRRTARSAKRPMLHTPGKNMDDDDDF
jgi:hypothetical protein